MVIYVSSVIQNIIEVDKMKVSEFQHGDILWIYNSYEEYYAELEFVQVNEDGTSRFHITGETTVDEPEYGYSLDSIEFRNIKLRNGKEKIKVVSTNGISYKRLKFKEHFKTLFRNFINSTESGL